MSCPKMVRALINGKAETYYEKNGNKKTMKISGLRNNNGFTLVEILVAMSILTIALLGLASVTVMVIKGNYFSKTVTTATTLARDRMEQLKNTSYADLALPPLTDYAKTDSTIQSTQAADSIYTRTKTITYDSPAANMATIVVMVQWNWQGANRNVTLRSIVTR